MSSTLRAFHNNPAIKEKYLQRVRRHRMLDELIQGTGWDAASNKGCAVGCTLDKYDHDAYETELGIPAQVAYLEDTIFEGLTLAAAMQWPEQFLDAVPVGADLSKIIPQIVIWQFEDPKYGLRHTMEVQENPDLRRVCEDLVSLLKRLLANETVSSREWDNIYDRAGAWARAGAGAGAGAWVWAGARAGARYITLSNKLLSLLREAPVGGTA